MPRNIACVALRRRTRSVRNNNPPPLSNPTYPTGRHGTAGALAEALGTAGITRLEAV
ncbi:hypothetical protein [Kingella potus]|nr:hypothetical protein [Kingella potus]UOP00237.1 hypothetical protein LVJ84_09920 [Kingella potus]